MHNFIVKFRSNRFLNHIDANHFRFPAFSVFQRIRAAVAPPATLQQ